VELIVAALQNAPMQPVQPAGFAAVSRAVVSVAADLFTGVQRAVVGTANMRTARDNARDATLADWARNQARADLSREVAAMMAGTAGLRGQKSLVNTH
jgi:hypothetical protein